MRSNNLWTTEGISGVCQNELTAGLVHRAVAAFAGRLVRQHDGSVGESREPGSRPKVVVAGDGRPLAAELLFAAAEAARWAGCDVIEQGDSASGAVVASIRQIAAEGGLLVGNAPSETHTASVSFFGHAGAPWSLHGSLDEVKASFDMGQSRPVRAAGASQRRLIETEHGKLIQPGTLVLQRGLRIVFDSACRPLECRLRELLSEQCQLIAPEPLPLSRPAPGKPTSPRPTIRQRREKMVARQVIADAADVGIWVDGIGEACTIIDDRGLAILPDKLVAVLARCPFDETENSIDFVEGTTREAAFHQFARNGATLAGDQQGRIWFRTTDGPPLLDALLTVVRLMTLLDATNQPLRKLVS